MIGASAERGNVEVSADDRILEVVHRVGDVVAEVHHLRLDAAHRLGRAGTQPVEGILIVGVVAELAAAARVGDALLRRPRVLATRVEAGAGQVEAVRAAIGPEHLGLQPGEQAERLGVALEPADVVRPGGQRALPVVTEGRVPEVMGEAGAVDDIRIEPQVDRELAADLRDLERMGEPVAGEVEARGRAEHLRLDGEAAQGAGMQHAPAIAGEVAATVRVLLGQPALGVGLVVAGQEHAARAIPHWCPARLR